MSALAAEPVIEAELWVSFAAMLRAYGLIAGLNSGSAPEIDSTDDSVTLRMGHARLVVDCDLRTGAGKWLLAGEQSSTQGCFLLMPEGRISVDGMSAELDHAAIDFASLLMRAAELSAKHAAGENV